MNTKMRIGTMLLVAGLASACGDDKSEDVMGSSTGGQKDGGDSGDSPTGGGKTGEDNTGVSGTSDDGGTPPEPTCPDLADRKPVSIDADLDKGGDWTCENDYYIEGRVYVRGGTLKIGPGTRITGGQESALIITKEAKIEAEGTASEPVVFTSDQPEGGRKPSDWQGLIVMGKAKINRKGGTNPFEGLPNTAENVYGGTDDKHNCGTLKYVRIEFAGYEILPGKEVNGLSLCGCGSDTTLDYIQVHKSADDGVEFFGGSASIKHLVSSSYDDDGLDWDEGWKGNAQFIALQQPLASMEDDPNGFEGDNQKEDNNATPVSTPNVWNATLIGGDSVKARGMVLRRGMQGAIHNFIVQGFSVAAIDVQDAVTATNLKEGDLKVANGLFFDVGADGKTYFPAETDSDDDDVGFDEKEFFTDEKLKNAFEDPKLGDAKSRTAPNFVPAASSPAKDDAATPPDNDWFDVKATYKGAFEPGGADWTDGWTSYAAD